jgi:peroxiredoxin
MISSDPIKAPELIVEQWLNTTTPISLSQLHGKVVALYAFQMLCPGCVQHSLPQANKVNQLFANHNLITLGLHAVFEHHAAMTEVSLRAFLYEYQIDFPVAIDKPSQIRTQPIPQTMESYAMDGTPSLILIDKKGYIRKHKMGHEQDLIVGAEIMTLLNE